MARCIHGNEVSHPRGMCFAACSGIVEKMGADLKELREYKKRITAHGVMFFPSCGHYAKPTAENRCPVCADLSELRKDKARLDWLENNPEFHGKPWKITNRIDGCWTVRAAIDAAMEAHA